MSHEIVPTHPQPVFKAPENEHVSPLNPSHNQPHSYSWAQTLKFILQWVLNNPYKLFIIAACILVPFALIAVPGADAQAVPRRRGETDNDLFSRGSDPFTLHGINTHANHPPAVHQVGTAANKYNNPWHDFTVDNVMQRSPFPSNDILSEIESYAREIESYAREIGWATVKPLIPGKEIQDQPFIKVLFIEKDLETTKKILKDHPEVLSYVDSTGWSAVSYCIANSNYDALILLLKHGATVRKFDLNFIAKGYVREGEILSHTFYHYLKNLVKENEIDKIKLLCQHGFCQGASFPNIYVLAQAIIIENQVQLFKEVLLKAMLSPLSCKFKHEVLSICAAATANSNRLAILKILIKEGLDVNHPAGPDDVTLLQIAAYKGFDNYAAYLLSLPDIDINAKDARGRTALDIAIFERRIGIENLLLEKGAKGRQTRNEKTYNVLVNVIDQFNEHLLEKGMSRQFMYLNTPHGGHYAYYAPLLSPSVNNLYFTGNKEECPPLMKSLIRGTHLTETLKQKILELDSLPYLFLGENNICHVLADKGELKLLKKLYKKFKETSEVENFFTPNNVGRTPMHVAAIKGETEVIEFLIHIALEQNKLVDGPDATGLTSLHLAEVFGQTKVIIHLIKGDYQKLQHKGQLFIEPSTFMSTATQKDTRALTWMLNHVDVHALDETGSNALIYAATAMNTEAIKLLLPHYDDISQLAHVNHEGVSASYAAVSSGNTYNLLLILEQASKIIPLPNSIYQAAQTIKDDSDDFDELLSLSLSASYRQVINDLQLNKPVFEGSKQLSCLTKAVISQHFRMVNFLLNARVCPNIEGNARLTPLHHAAIAGNKNIVALLLHYSADPYSADKWGNYPITYARENGFDEIVALLPDEPWYWLWNSYVRLAEREPVLVFGGNLIVTVIVLVAIINNSSCRHDPATCTDCQQQREEAQRRLNAQVQRLLATDIARHLESAPQAPAVSSAASQEALRQRHQADEEQKRNELREQLIARAQGLNDKLLSASELHDKVSENFKLAIRTLQAQIAVLIEEEKTTRVFDGHLKNVTKKQQALSKLSLETVKALICALPQSVATLESELVSYTKKLDAIEAAINKFAGQINGLKGDLSRITNKSTELFRRISKREIFLESDEPKRPKKVKQSLPRNHSPVSPRLFSAVVESHNDYDDLSDSSSSEAASSTSSATASASSSTPSPKALAYDVHNHDQWVPRQPEEFVDKFKKSATNNGKKSRGKHRANREKENSNSVVMMLFNERLAEFNAIKQSSLNDDDKIYCLRGWALGLYLSLLDPEGQLKEIVTDASTIINMRHIIRHHLESININDLQNLYRLLTKKTATLEEATSKSDLYQRYQSWLGTQPNQSDSADHIMEMVKLEFYVSKLLDIAKQGYDGPNQQSLLRFFFIKIGDTWKYQRQTDKDKFINNIKHNYPEKFSDLVSFLDEMINYRNRAAHHWTVAFFAHLWEVIAKLNNACEILTSYTDPSCQQACSSTLSR